MNIFIIFTLSIISILLIGRKIFYTVERNLFKDQASWSAKDINIKYTKSSKSNESKRNDNYLKMIADESEIYLADQSTLEENE